MIIKFRFHRGGLKESLATMRTFTSWEQLFAFLESDSSKYDGVPMFHVADIVIADSPHHDKRIGWKDARWVCVKRFGAELRDPPVPIGCVATEFCEPTDLSWQN